jgi:hypothetical protein
LSEWERRRILAAAGKTPILVLTDLTFADKLLTKVGLIVGASTSLSPQKLPNL